MLNVESFESNVGWLLRYWMRPSGRGIEPEPPVPLGTARNAMFEPVWSPTSLVSTPPIPARRAFTDCAPAVPARSPHQAISTAREIAFVIGVTPRGSVTGPWNGTPHRTRDPIGIPPGALESAARDRASETWRGSRRGGFDRSASM